jgi:hypothetical protein
MDCNIRKVEMDRIEKLEMVNSIAADWRTLVDGGDQDALWSEHDMFMTSQASEHVPCVCLAKIC